MPLHPSHFGPFANVVLEALASGLPFVTSKKNEAHKVIADGGDGTVLSTIDVLTVCYGLLPYLNNQRLATMQQAVRSKAEDFSIPAIITHSLKLYELVDLQGQRKVRKAELRPLRPLFQGVPV